MPKAKLFRPRYLLAVTSRLLHLVSVAVITLTFRDAMIVPKRIQLRPSFNVYEQIDYFIVESYTKISANFGHCFLFVTIGDSPMRWTIWYGDCWTSSWNCNFTCTIQQAWRICQIGQCAARTFSRTLTARCRICTWFPEHQLNKVDQALADFRAQMTNVSTTRY